MFHDGTLYTITDLTLSLSSTTATKLCTPEILFLDEHPLYGLANYPYSFAKNISDSSNATNKKTFASANELTDWNWVIGSSCFSETLAATTSKMQLFGFISSSPTGNVRDLVLLTGIYFVVGPDNENVNNL